MKYIRKESEVRAFRLVPGEITDAVMDQKVPVKEVVSTIPFPDLLDRHTLKPPPPIELRIVLYNGSVWHAFEGDWLVIDRRSIYIVDTETFYKEYRPRASKN